jgi:predicted S18 family serine protease
MVKLATFAIAVLLLALPLHAQVASMQVPAVLTTQGGELVTLEVEIRAGTGMVYVATTPLVGTQTQDSARTAFTVARNIEGIGDTYDALIRLRDASGSASVDGPSAGAAMTLLMLSIFENKSVRNDITMTGTIGNDGTVGAVGAVGEKTEAAVEGGMKAILIPTDSDVLDKMVLSILGERWNISIIEVDNISEAEALAFSSKNVTLQSNIMDVEPGSPVNVTATEINCTDCHIDEFKTLASNIIEQNHALLDEVNSRNNSEFSDFIKVIEVNMEDSENAENWNYPYTAANSAFLTEINLNFLKDSNITYDTFMSRIADVSNCIGSTKRPQVTMDNFEWVAGGDERLEWSSKKLNEITSLNYSPDDEETILLEYQQLLTAESWCKVSQDMYSVASGISGVPANESNLKAFAAGKMAEAGSMLDAFGGAEDFGDAEWRFEATSDEFNKSLFMAAVFDSDYLIGTIDSLNSTINTTSFFSTEFGPAKSWHGMWAALYNNHAKYVYLSEQGNVDATPIILANYAELLDNDTVQMKGLMEAPVAVPTENATAITVQPAPSYDNDLALLLVFCVIIAIFLNIVQLFKAPE